MRKESTIQYRQEDPPQQSIVVGEARLNKKVIIAVDISCNAVSVNLSTQVLNIYS